MRGHTMLEVLVFLGSTVLGVYAMGQLWHSVFDWGGAGTLLWAAILFLCLFLLSKQMGRVQARQTVARKGESK